MTANGRFLVFFQMMKSKRMPRSSVPEHHRPERAQSVWLRLSLVALSVLTLASCKIRIIVPEGGHVYTQSGAYQCDGGQTCNIDVIDFFFDETFIANPYRGYAFRFWKQGTGRFCGKSPNPCRLLTTIFTGDWVPAVLPWLESSDIVFTCSLCSRQATISYVPTVKTGDSLASLPTYHGTKSTQFVPLTGLPNVAGL